MAETRISSKVDEAIRNGLNELGKKTSSCSLAVVPEAVDDHVRRHRIWQNTSRLLIRAMNESVGLGCLLTE